MTGRLGRTIRSLAAVGLLGAGLAGYNAYALRRDVALATGPTSDAQHEWFLHAADRPDIDLFYQSLTHAQRMKTAAQVGGYADPRLAPLVGALLGTFDTQARAALTDALLRIGESQPEAVATQLKLSGSLQLFSVTAALRRLGAKAIPAVTQQLDVAAARPQAIAFLVATGHGAVPYLLPQLNSRQTDTRLAAVDALGKLGAREAEARILQFYSAAPYAEREPYLSALSGIAGPQSEKVLETEAENESTPTPRRAVAMLGLGREGSEASIATLWSLSRGDDWDLRDAVVSALQVAGSRSLARATTPELGLRVAMGIQDAAATRYIGSALADPGLLTLAAGAAVNRPELVSDLVRALRRSSDGVAMDAVARALGTTPAGVAELKRLIGDPIVGGFAMRRLSLEG